MARIMAYQVSVTVCMLWVLAGAGRFLMVVKGEPNVSLTIDTPVAERKEGGTVRMRCVATNLVSDQVVEFRIPSTTILWNGTFIDSFNGRVTFNLETSNIVITQEFKITNLQRGDTNEYFCNVNYQEQIMGRDRLVATSMVSLSVLYFPDKIFPVCFPDGIITENNATELTLQCLSEAGNSAVMMEVSEIPAACETHLWTTSVVSNTLIRSLTVTAGASTNNATFECTISSAYFPGIRRSCTIGPIVVNGVTGPVPTCTTEPTTVTLDYNATQDHNSTFLPLSSFSEQTAVIVSVSAAGAAVFVVITIGLLMCRRRFCKQPIPKLLSDLNSKHRKEPQTNTAGYTNVSPNVSSSLPQTTETGSLPVYATPQKSKNLEVNADTTKSENLPDVATAEQCYANAAFELKDGNSLTSPSWSIATSDSKTVAIISPVTKVPKKPLPYKPKAQRASDTSSPRITAADEEDVIASRPKSVPLMQPEHISAPGGDVSYAQVQVPCENDVLTETPSSDHIVYADLDLQQDYSEDGEETSSTSRKQMPVYAQVNNIGP